MEQLWQNVELTTWGEVHLCHPRPETFAKKKREGENNFCLWFMVSASGTLLVDSLNCPSRAKHTPLKKINTHLFVCVFVFFFSPSVLRVCVFMGCLSLLWRKMMRSIILHSLGRHRFLFPCGVPALCKNTDQEFTVSCKKGLYVWRFLSPPSYSHRRNVQVNSGRALLENSKLSLFLFAPWGWG